ncbi:MAG: dipeptide epimerase [Thermoanaerobaculia bacterium]|jgi:L-alanine-DL-glutamate epimerase-like enolase superfamily enzyme
MTQSAFPSLSRRGLLFSSAAAAASSALPQALFAESPSRPSTAPVSLAYRPLVLKLAHTWTIARGSSDEKKNGLLTVTADGVTGYGEAAANKRWSQSWETSETAFARVEKAVAGLSPWDHLTWLEKAEAAAGNDHEVVAALDMALWDWKGKKLGRPVHELLGVPAHGMPVTTFSIGIDSAEVMKQKTREAAAFPKLKIKIGLANDEENIAAIRSVTDKPITVDANEGWTTVEEARKKIVWLNGVRPLYLEQPMPAAQDAEMAKLKGLASYPVLGDEGVLSASDVAKKAGLFDGVVVKLAKAGGITRSWEQIVVARAVGLKTMCGCMIESSVGIAAGLALGPLFDWLDLDGNLLLAKDPFRGLRIEKGVWRMPDGPGLGVVPA